MSGIISALNASTDPVLDDATLEFCFVISNDASGDDTKNIINVLKTTYGGMTEMKKLYVKSTTRCFTNR